MANRSANNPREIPGGAMKNADGVEYATPWAIRCHGGSVPGHACGLVPLTYEQYEHQMSRPDSAWFCPHCGGDATWDDNCPETNPAPDGGSDDEAE